MLELPNGITTSNGNWYHITSEGIENYVPGLLNNYPLKRIIQEADAWVKSSDGFALMLFFILAFFGVTPLLATAISMGFYFFWYFNTSVFVNVTSTPIAKILNKDGVVYAVSALFLIGISINEITAGLGIGTFGYSLHLPAKSWQCMESFREIPLSLLTHQKLLLEY